MNHFPEVLEIIGLKPEEKFDLIDASGHILLCNVRFTDTGSLIGADGTIRPERRDLVAGRDPRDLYRTEKNVATGRRRTVLLCRPHWYPLPGHLAWHHRPACHAGHEKRI